MENSLNEIKEKYNSNFEPTKMKKHASNYTGTGVVTDDI